MLDRWTIRVVIHWTRRGEVKRLFRKKISSKADPMDCCHMILKMHHSIEDYPFSLAHRMVANYPLICWLLAQMKVFNMVHHMRNATKSARPFVKWEPLVPYTDYTLGLLTDEGEFIRLWEEIGIRTFFFNENLRGWSPPRLASLQLLSRGERYHKIDSKDLPRDDGLRL